MKNLTVKYPLNHSHWFNRWPQRELIAVDNVSFMLYKNETLAVVGESGSGKSTIGLSVLNLIPITDGSIIFKEQAIHRLNRRQMLPIRRCVQIIFQSPPHHLILK